MRSCENKQKAIIKMKNEFLFNLVNKRASNQITIRSKNGRSNIMVQGFRPYRRNISYTINFKNQKLTNSWRTNTKTGSDSTRLEPELIPGLNMLISLAAQKHHTSRGTITITV